MQHLVSPVGIVRSCFKEKFAIPRQPHLAPAARGVLELLPPFDQGEELWYDSNGISWLSVARQEARDYLSALCLELAELGFDEILLEHAGFPDQGRVATIGAGDNYPSKGRGDAVAAFLRELSQTLEQAGCFLSVLAADEELTGETSGSGVSAKALAGISGRVWTAGEAGADALASALAGAGMERAGERLVLTGELPGDIAWTGSTAVLLD